MKRVPTRLIFGLSAAGLVLSGCVYPFNQCPLNGTGCDQYEVPYEVRQRERVYDPRYLKFDYCEEHAYIEARRSSGGKENKERCQEKPVEMDKPHYNPPAPPENLVGLALSGGGLRSATVQLGILQALNHISMGPDKTMLGKIDYLSTVSGGSYLAGWMVAHLDMMEEKDGVNYKIGTRRLETLLDNEEDFVGHLRVHAGFLNKGGFWEGLNIIWDYLWRLPANAIWGIGLHYKAFPEIDNEIHMIAPYLNRIEKTYLRGKATTNLAQINRKDPLSPYLIINGNLVNSGLIENYNFEFTRDFTGSDGLGYVKTPGFNLPVREVHTKLLEVSRSQIPQSQISLVEAVFEDGPIKKEVPIQITVEEPPVVIQYQEGSEQKEVRVTARELEKPLGFTAKDSQGKDVTFTVSMVDRCNNPEIKKNPPNASIMVDVKRGNSCVRLSEAIAASGAAIDLKSTLVEFFPENQLIHIILDKVLSPFNPEFDYHARNFAPSNIVDYAQMLTTKRIWWPDTDDPWLEITDGSFFDNLGVYSLLRRGVQHIIVADVTWDSGWKYKYLRQLQTRVKELGMRWCNGLEFPKKDKDGEGEIVWYKNFWIKRPGQPPAGDTYAVIHYLKPYAFNSALFEGNPDFPEFKEPGKPFISASPVPRISPY